MSVADTLSAFLDIGNKIDVLWNIFIAVHFGIFSLYYFITRQHGRLNAYEKIVCGAAYYILFF